MFKFFTLYFVLCLPLITTQTAMPNPLPLAQYQIALPSDAIPAEQTAAAELADFLEQITGVQLPVVAESQITPRTNTQVIYLGQSETIAHLLGDIDFATLRADEVILKKVPEGFVISGARPRGALYAVYTLLEDHFGVRFWSPQETFIPQNPQADLPSIDHRYAPPIFSREFFSSALRSDPVYAARRKINGHFSVIPETHGGHLPIMDWCHTFRLFDTSANPQWNSLVGGRRTVNGMETGQLCLSNSDLRTAYKAFLIDRVYQNPNAEILSVSINDCDLPCECDACTAMKQANGWNETDLLLDFVNDCAQALAELFPKLKIETIAYLYAQGAPNQVRAASNVIVRLCTDLADLRATPIAKTGFAQIIQAWEEKADSLYIWNYVSNFPGWLMPFPNLFSLGENIAFFRDHHTQAIFDQGDSQTQIGDLMVLRNWVQSQLLWNPDLNTRELIATFCQAYYGPAAPLILTYLERLHAEASRPEAGSLYGLNTDTWLRPEVTLELLSIMDQAADLARGTPHEARVLAATLPIHYALLMSEVTATEARREALGLTDAQLNQRWEHVRQITESLGGESHYRENQLYPDLFRWLDRRYNPASTPTDLPTEVTGIDPYRLLDMNADDLRVYFPEKGTQVVEDPATFSGKAVRMNSVLTGWAVQLNMIYYSANAWFQNSPEASIYVRLRKEAATDASAGTADQPAMLMSVFPHDAWEEKNWSPNQLASEYEWKKVGHGPFMRDPAYIRNQYVYIAPLPNPAIEHLFVDRILLVFDEPAVSMP